MVWADVKNNIAQNHIHSSLDEKINALNLLFSEFTAEKWQRCDDHVQKNENDYWDRDNRFDNIIDPIIINLQDDNDSSSGVAKWKMRIKVNLCQNSHCIH